MEPIWRDCYESETQPSLRPHFSCEFYSTAFFTYQFQFYNYFLFSRKNTCLKVLNTNDTFTSIFFYGEDYVLFKNIWYLFKSDEFLSNGKELSINLFAIDIIDSFLIVFEKNKNICDENLVT